MNRKQYKSRRGQAGWGIIEIIVVLILVTLAMVFVGPRLARAFFRQDVAMEATNIRDLVTSLQSFRDAGGLGSAGTNLVPMLQNNEALPASYRIVSNVPYNVWDGTVTVVAQGLGAAITYNKVPRADCIELVTRASANDLSTKINSAAAVEGRVNAVAANTSCAAGDNSLTFTTTR